MRAVNIGDLKNQLSAYLKHVQNGEEIVVRDRNVPVARILPIALTDLSDEESELVASGAMKLPERQMNWDRFWSDAKGSVSRRTALKASLDSRGGDR